jgi:hypothetical protein
VPVVATANRQAGSRGLGRDPTLGAAAGRQFGDARRGAWLSPTRPVTPEVAGSSPVAPVQRPCKRAYFVVVVKNTIGARAANDQNGTVGRSRRRRCQPAWIAPFAGWQRISLMGSCLTSGVSSTAHVPLDIGHSDLSTGYSTAPRRRLSASCIERTTSRREPDGGRPGRAGRACLGQQRLAAEGPVAAIGEARTSLLAPSDRRGSEPGKRDDDLVRTATICREVLRSRGSEQGGGAGPRP